MISCPHCQRQTKQGCTRKACELKESEADAARLASHFTAGNVIFSDYWRKHDLVLAFHPAKADRGWFVTVVGCDAAGIPTAGERIRQHATYPDKRDCIALTDCPINY